MQDAELAVDAPTAALWRAAEAQLYQVVVTSPDLYQRGVVLVGWLAEQLVGRCPTADDLMSVVAGEESSGWPMVGDAAAARTVSLDGLDVAAVGRAGCAMAARRLAAAQAQARRAHLLAAARRAGAAWVVLEEGGDPEGSAWSPYHRLEVRADCGLGVLVTTEPDDDLVGVVHHVRRVRVDHLSGALVDTGSAASCAADASLREDAAAASRADVDRFEEALASDGGFPIVNDVSDR